MRLHAAIGCAERFRAEADLQRQSQSSLTTGLAHDYNNLLSAIQGNVDLLLMNPILAGDLRHNLEQISRAAQKAAHLTRQVLESSRPLEGALPALNLNESLRRLRSGLSKTGKKSRVEFRLDRAIPLVHINYAVLADAVISVVQPAAERLTAAGSRLEIATVVGPKGEAILEVRALGADGAVFLEADGNRLAAAAKEFATGGAKLSLEGPHTLRVAFPAPEAQTADSPPPSDGLEKAGFGTILLVEDEDDVRTMTHRLLRREGYTVLEASSGVEGLDLFRNVGGMLDAVILDLNMPGMEGGEVLHHMRDLRPEIRVIVWSGLSEVAARQRMNGFNDVTFVEKPAQLADFPKMLNRILQED